MIRRRSSITINRTPKQAYQLPNERRVPTPKSQSFVGIAIAQRRMPCLDIATNVNLEGLDLDSIFSEATATVAAIMGKPETFVMVLLKGSVPITFGGNKEPAAMGEIISMDAVERDVKRKLIAAIGTILENKLSIPRTRFIFKVYNPANRNQSKL